MRKQTMWLSFVCCVLLGAIPLAASAQYQDPEKELTEAMAHPILIRDYNSGQSWPRAYSRCLIFPHRIVLRGATTNSDGQSTSYDYEKSIPVDLHDLLEMLVRQTKSEISAHASEPPHGWTRYSPYSYQGFTRFKDGSEELTVTFDKNSHRSRTGAALARFLDSNCDELYR